MASVRERSGPRGKRYTALFRDGQGRQRSAGSFGTRKEAQRAGARAEVTGSVLSPPVVYRPETRGGITLASYAPTWLAGHRLEASTRASYRWALRAYLMPRFGSMAMSGITPADVRVWFRELEAQGKSGAILSKLRMVGSVMFATAVADKFAETNPFAGQKIVPSPRREMTIISKDEYYKLLGEVPEHYRLLVRTLAETGMRWGEALALRPEDLDSDDVLHIRRVMSDIGTGDDRFPVKGMHQERWHPENHGRHEPRQGTPRRQHGLLHLPRHQGRRHRARVLPPGGLGPGQDPGGPAIAARS